MGMVAAGIGLDFVLTDHTGVAERWILAGGLTVAFLSLAMIVNVTLNPNDPRTKQKAVVRLLAIPVVLIVGAIAGEVAMGVTATIVVVLVVAQVAIDLVFEPARTGSSEH